MADISIKGTDPSKVQANNKNRPSYARMIAGAYAGYITNKAITTYPYCATNVGLMRQMQNISNLQDDEFEAVNKAIGQAFEASGLKKNGVKLIEVGEHNADEARKMLADEFKNSVDRIFLRKNKINLLVEENVQKLLKGNNALNLQHSNNILMPEGGKLGISIFHEMGHAATNLMGKTGNLLRSSRCLAYLTTPILLAALLVDKKPEDEKPKGALDKGLGFVKKHAGKLAFLSYLPIVIEEAVASAKAEKIAKPFLSPELLNKMKQVNSLGLSSYINLALAVGFGTYVAKTIRDVIVHNKKQDN